MAFGYYTSIPYLIDLVRSKRESNVFIGVCDYVLGRGEKGKSTSSPGAAGEVGREGTLTR